MSKKDYWLQQIGKKCHFKPGTRWQLYSTGTLGSLYIPKDALIDGYFVKQTRQKVYIMNKSEIFRGFKRDLIFEE